MTQPDHHVTVDRGPLGKQWRCDACPWTSPVVLWGSPPAAHAQAARAAVDHQAALDAVRHASLDQDEEGNEQ